MWGRRFRLPFPTMRASGLLFLVSALAFGQTFEVASVKPAPVREGERVYFGPPRGGPGTPDPTQITWTYAAMKALLMTAYDLKAYQLTGPAWIASERYDVVAKVPPSATKEQVAAMWRNLLAERFGLVVHHESKDFQVEELLVSKGGTKLKDTAQDLAEPLPPGPPQVKNGALVSAGVVSMISPGPPPKVHTMAVAQPISKLTEMLSNQLNHPVLDKTGLTGTYDFTLDYNVSGLPGMPPPPPATPGDVAPDPGLDLAAAVQQQLGLRLVTGKAKIDVVIVDKLERVPTSN
jgi:uncharacterized protein (TIGR03435 family)